MIEMALVLPILLLLICGVMDFGFLFSAHEAVTNAARNGARYAITHPSAWTNADPAGVATIEGQIQQAGGTARIPNTDSNISITYLKSDGTTCGSYSQSTNAFVGSGGNTQTTCLVAGAFIQVRVTYRYTFMTPVLGQLLGTSANIPSTTTMVEEQ